ncbi:hypothetical protein BDF20DRAFT_914507 [Mycotypha africana]|uniref:uncharacterized protein n=1 Tax=Mycotypha africana TaxID=64632 RepID=UPI002300187B|nr:uncharacterized protein BDF20DRAFT_914507 [Mycotypha africana]KAI8975615.1 hypothetical protein BDF20DRAFT_914507 [Mycotypha africana]
MPLFSKKKIAPTEISDDIEKATDSSVKDLDWALVFKLCESVNSTELGAKEARKLLQKKMISTEPKTQLLALEILNALSENCTKMIRPQLTAKSFGEELNNLVSSKTIDGEVYDKLAQCLENWARLSNGDPQFSAIHKAYNAITKGASSRQRQTARHKRSEHTVRSTGPPKPENIKRDIELARNSAQLFSQTLSFTDPTQEDISTNVLIQEFRTKCIQAQQLLAAHLETCDDSDLLTDLINTNNELLSCFKSYDEMLEQHAVNEATINSQKLHNRNTRDNDQLQQQRHLESLDNIGEASSTIPNPKDETLEIQKSSSSKNPFKLRSDDPFDPFGDLNQIDASHTVPVSERSVGDQLLPPPLTPQKLHD